MGGITLLWRARTRPAVRSLALAGFVLLLAGSFGPAAAGDRPESFVRNFADEGLAVLSDRDMSGVERRAAFRRILSQNFDMALVGRFVLGKHWRRATASERQEYMGLFEDFVVASTTRRLSNYANETIEIGRSRPKGERGAVVASRILRPDAESIRVDWRLHRRDGTWRIVDVAVEGVSLVLTQRNEFDAVIRSGGGRIDALLERLREQTASLASAS